MSNPVNRERALAVLCDLAFTIGGEVELKPLLTRSLQRFLYHTGFPVGLMVGDEIFSPEQSWVDGRLDLAIGDYELRHEEGGRMRLPAALMAPRPAVIESGPALGELHTRKAMEVALSLPVEGYGHMLLLSPRRLEAELPYAELFVQVLSRLATAIRLCTGYERDVQSRIERRAYFNELSGLPNAARFNQGLREEAEKARRAGSKLAVVYLDVDDFARTNSEWGQSGADRLLVKFANRLSGRTIAGEYCAHLMADEFALLIPEVRDRHAVAERVSALLDVGKPFVIAAHAVSLRASAGVSLFPEDAADTDLVLRYAQMAMHQAKQDERGGYRFFDAEQDRLTHERRSLLERFREALGSGELCLHYQPKVDMVDGRLVGVEALLRWHDPERGLRLPEEFLAVVDSSDLVCELGRWGMEQALAQARTWRGEGLEVPISVNIAARHFEEPDFVEQVRYALVRYPDVPAELLELEILESTAIADFAQAQGVIQACAQLGVHTALDDFGTGYSSLAYLSRLPARSLKVDQTFVRNMFELPTEPAVVRAIVHIAEIFGLNIVAEGVELLPAMSAMRGALDEVLSYWMKGE